MKLLIATIALWAWTSYGQTKIHYPDTLTIQKEEHEYIWDCSCDCGDPEFPGGEEGLMAYLHKNIHVPDKVSADGLCSYYGTCFVQFTIDREGSVTDVRIAKGIHPDFDEEVLRVISKMPKWTPGFKNDKPINVKYTLPVHLQFR